jgi:hypothetical protein
MKFKTNSSLILIVLFFAISCSKEEIRTENTLKTDFTVQLDSNIVTLENARLFAKDIFKSSKNKTAKNAGSKNIESITPIGSDSKRPSYFIINYKGGGFLILAGDKRTYPVMAYSENEHFDLNAESYPDLLVEWLKMQDELVGSVRNDTIAERTHFNELWRTDEVEDFIFSKQSRTDSKNAKTNAFSCESQPFTTPILIASYGPLLPTTWGQGIGYNNKTEYKACSNYNNGYAPTGCVATAMSQVLRYYQYPNTYNWSIMPSIITSYTSDGANELHV